MIRKNVKVGKWVSLKEFFFLSIKYRTFVLDQPPPWVLEWERVGQTQAKTIARLGTNHRSSYT
jgi:hypothetical protein